MLASLGRENGHLVIAGAGWIGLEVAAAARGYGVLDAPARRRTRRSARSRSSRCSGARRADRARDREHWRLKGGRARLHHHVLALVDEGLLREVDADDDGPPFYVDAEAELDGDPAPPVLLCPFDNLLWDRPLLSGSSAFATDRGLQARARARVRLLRAPLLPATGSSAGPTSKPTAPRAC